MDKKIRLAETLKRRILSMELAPGSIVDEISLSEEFGISRSPVRELIRQMAAEGYLELEANRAVRVSSMSHQSLRNFFLAAPLIYIATTQIAAINATPIDIQGLKEIQRRFRQAIDENDLEGRVYYNNQFHFEIGRIAQNAYLLPSLERLLIDHARLGKTFYRQPTSVDMQEDLDIAVLQHDQIIDAIERHNAVEAGELIRVHMDLSRRRMTEYVVPQGIDIPITY